MLFSNSTKAFMHLFHLSLGSHPDKGRGPFFFTRLDTGLRRYDRH